jgi:hypothetical protein
MQDQWQTRRKTVGKKKRFIVGSPYEFLPPIRSCIIARNVHSSASDTESTGNPVRRSKKI